MRSNSRRSRRRRKRSLRPANPYLLAGSRPSSRRSTAAPTTPPAPTSSASSRRPRPSSRPSSTARRRRRGARAARRTASSSCSAANQAACGPLNNKIQQMRDNLDRIQADIERLRGDPAPEREGQRRAILVALAQNNCGQQYQQQVAATPPPRSGGLFESLFGPKSVFTPGSSSDAPATRRRAAPSAPSACAPATASIIRSPPPPTPARFAEDEKACRAVLPGRRGAALFPPQSRRGHQRGGVGRHPAALHGAAECVPLSDRARPELQLPASGRNLVAGVEEHRGPHGRAGRHRGERPAGAAVVAAARRRAGQADQASRPSPPARPDPKAAQTAAASAGRGRTRPAATQRRRRGAVQARSQPQGARGRADVPAGRAERIFQKSNASVLLAAPGLSSARSGSGNGAPVSRKRLTIG